nr:retrotransposon protein, putative, Ty3-gypsy subclass [Tanacetum cinerariifolium]
TEFRLDEDDVLWQGTRVCVPNDATLREALLTEAHSYPFSVHPGSTKMYHDLKQHFWWSGMKRDVATFVSRLPWTQRRHDAIWVVVDRLTKSAHFLPIHKDYSVSKLAETFQQEIVRLHGNWDDYICLVEFAYNNSWHASIKCTPFEMLYGRKCRASICWDQVGERVIEGPEIIKVINEKVVVAKEKLKEARTRQKSYADKHRRSIEFQPGDRVFLKVSPVRGVRRFGIKGKLSPRFIGPFKILDRVDPCRLSYVEEPEAILDRQDRVMTNKTIPFVKILWRNHPERCIMFLIRGRIILLRGEEL